MASGDVEVISPALSFWNFWGREKELRADADRIPTWRLANVARKFLAGVTHEASLRYPSPTVELVEDLDAQAAQELASVQLGGILVRSVSSSILLIGAGYEREAFGPNRISVECVLRGRQMLSDPSGSTAKKILQGHSPGSLKSLAGKHGQKEEIEFLDRFSHADGRSLLTLGTPKHDAPTEFDVELRPRRGVLRPAMQLYESAHLAGSYTTIIAEIFGIAVQIPTWMSEQLQHYRNHPIPPPL